MTQEATIALKEWVLTVPVVLLLTVPGLGVGYLFAAHNRLSHAWAIAASFVASAAWLSIVAIIAFYSGLSLTVVVVAYAAAIPVSLWLVWRVRRGDQRLEGIGSGGLALSLIAAVTALWQGPWWFGSPDSFYHIAASRSLLSTGRPIVTDPFFGTASTVPDSTAGMWNTMQAVVTRLIGTDIASLYRGFTAFGAAAVILAFWLLAKQVSKSDRAATIATLAYACAAWYTDFRAFAYPNKLSISFAFAALALLVMIAEEPRRDQIVAAAVTGFVALTVHLASGELALLGGGGILVMLVVVAFAGRRSEDARSGWLAARGVLVSLALMVAFALPTLYPRVAALSDSTVIGSDSFIWAGEQVVEGFPLGIRMVTPGGFDFGGPWLFWFTAAVGILMIYALIKGEGRRTAAALPLVLLAHAITVVPPLSTFALNFSSYMVARMVELLRFSPYIALAWSLGTLIPAVKTPARILGAGLLVAAAVTAAPYIRWTYVQGEGEERRGNLFSVQTNWEKDIRRDWGFSNLFQIREIVGDSYPVIAADPYVSYHISGLADVAVVASLKTHLPVFMGRAENAERADDMELFFSADTTSAEREAIVERWDIEYVFSWRYLDGYALEDALRSDPNLERELYDGNVSLYRVKR